MVHNCSPHPSLNTTPFEALFGRDAILPGLVEHTRDVPEELRSAKLRDQTLRSLFQHRLRGLYTREAKDEPVLANDIVVYRLSDPERQDHPHYSSTGKWNPHWSLPHRVVSVKHSQAVIKPLWYQGNMRTVALPHLRHIAPQIPKILVDAIPDVINLPPKAIQALEEDGLSPFAPIPVSEPPVAPVSNPGRISKRRKVLHDESTPSTTTNLPPPINPKGRIELS